MGVTSHFFHKLGKSRGGKYMKLRYFGFWLAFLFLLLNLDIVWADTHPAASCSQSDVQAAYNAASAGDMVIVPAGSCTWSSTLAINKSISLIGLAGSSTTITNATGGTLINVSLSSDVPVRISGFKFIGLNDNTDSRSVVINGPQDDSFGLTQIRVDNNIFNKGKRALYITGKVFGVADHNTFLNTRLGFGCDGVNWGHYSWDYAITPGTANAFFFEDNTITIDSNYDQAYPNISVQIYFETGSRGVVRYNTFDSHLWTGLGQCAPPYDSHGNQDYNKDFRGQPLIEVYNNSFNMEPDCWSFMDIRGGSSLIHDNTYIQTGGSAPIANLWEEEVWETAFFNALRIQWPAQDQINNTFFWNNTLNGSPVTTSNVNIHSASEAVFIQENRDYFMHAPASTGGKASYTGSRQGGSTTSPTPKDIGNLIFTSSGANAYYPYTPYTYPHPLTYDGIKPPSNLRLMQPQ